MRRLPAPRRRVDAPRHQPHERVRGHVSRPGEPFRYPLGCFGFSVSCYVASGRTGLRTGSCSVACRTIFAATVLRSRLLRRLSMNFMYYPCADERKLAKSLAIAEQVYFSDSLPALIYSSEPL